MSINVNHPDIVDFSDRIISTTHELFGYITGVFDSLNIEPAPLPYPMKSAIIYSCDQIKQQYRGLTELPKTFIQDWTKLCDNARRFAEQALLRLNRIDLSLSSPESRTALNELEDYLNAIIKTLLEVTYEPADSTESNSEADN